MKALLKILSIFIAVISISSCKSPEIEADFEDQRKLTIYDYMVQNTEKYSSFLSIIEKGGIAKTLTAYNPYGIGYTLFLPDNEAVNKFIEDNETISSLSALLEDVGYCAALSRYHVVNMGIETNNFPFGALPEYTLNGDYLTVGFVIETDTSYYKINNQAPVIQPNIELSNGFIHIIGSMLLPITYTTYQWLEMNPGYSIFKNAIDITGLKEMTDINTKGVSLDFRPFTLFVEHDSVFNKYKIFSLDDLIQLISPGRTDYTSTANPLYNFITYHMLPESMFLDDFGTQHTNYSTYSDIPLLINGLGLDITINKGKEVFDTIVKTPDTTYIDFVGFDYDASNLLTQSGVIHFITRVMRQKTPSRAIQTFEFYNEPAFYYFRQVVGSHLIKDPSILRVLSWSGPDLYFIETGDENSPAWSGDYLYINGDFTISYTIPKLVQGTYTVFLGADAFSQQNALVEVFIDGKKIGGLIDLTSGGSSTNPFARIELGTVNFLRYEQHTIEIQSLIPGRFIWDYIRFEPL